MSNPGFNLKVRVVENGYTIHVTHIDDNGSEEHSDHVTQEESEVAGLIDDLVRAGLDKAHKRDSRYTG